MSERLKNTKLVSNEDVIEDLTKNIQSLNNDDKSEEFTIEPDTSQNEVGPSESGDAGHSKTEHSYNTPEYSIKDHDKDDGDDKEDESDKESDIESSAELHNSEMNLSDDLKEERKIIAEALKEAGNEAYKATDYMRSIEKYTDGLNICPRQYSQQRAVLYCNRSAAKMMLEKHKQAIKDCTKAINLDDKYVKAYIRRAKCYEITEQYDDSLKDYQRILELDPSNSEAHKATIRLPPIIEERNEKLKTEMMGKLKDLGNLILKPFGLSTDCFKLEQDPESKGYKINFKQ